MSPSRWRGQSSLRILSVHLLQPVEMADVVEFFINHAISDSLGIIANAHLALADQLPKVIALIYLTASTCHEIEWDGVCTTMLLRSTMLRINHAWRFRSKPAKERTHDDSC